MRLRTELFVDDLDSSVAFYTGLLGFRVTRRSETYAVLVRGRVVLGFGLLANLSEHDDSGPGTVWRPLDGPRGAGVEIVLELDDVDELSALYEHCASRLPAAEPLRLQPWGLYDFRLTDPDGYYLRLTHGRAEESETAAPGSGVPMRRNVSSQGSFEDVYGYSRAVRAGDHIHVAGTTAQPPHLDETDAYRQARAALAIVEDALRRAGSSLAAVVRTVTYVTDIADADLVARAHREVFGAVRPAATLVQVARLLDPAMKVEIEVYAVETG